MVLLADYLRYTLSPRSNFSEISRKYLCLQPSPKRLLSPYPTQSSLPFCTGVQFSRDSGPSRVKRSNRSTRNQSAVNSLIPWFNIRFRISSSPRLSWWFSIFSPLICLFDNVLVVVKRKKNLIMIFSGVTCF